MEAADASRSNGSSPEARDARSPSGPNGSLENGTKADGKDAKTTNGHGGEAAEGKSLGSALKPGEGRKATRYLCRKGRAAQVHFLRVPEARGVHHGARGDPAEQLPPGRHGPFFTVQVRLRGGAVRLLHRQQAEGGQVLPGVPGLLLRAAPQAPPGGRRLPRPPAARAHPGL
uniref:Tripartite motif containing 29 n=3 Tax=Cercopithecinae TaxID=9528 RepID=A0A2K5KWJ7_CERAT